MKNFATKQTLIVLQSRVFTSAPVREFDGKIKFHYYQQTGGLCEAILNRPKQLNATDWDQQYLILKQFYDWHHNPQKVPKIFMNYGVGTFSAGGDLKGAYNTKTFEDWRDAYWAVHLNINQFLPYKFEPLHVCLINGFQFGAAATCSMHADFRISSDQTQFSMPEVAIGYITDAGSGYFFSRNFKGDKHLGLYLALTGKKIIGEDTVRYGTASHFIKHNDFKKI